MCQDKKSRLVNIVYSTSLFRSNKTKKLLYRAGKIYGKKSKPSVNELIEIFNLNSIRKDKRVIIRMNKNTENLISFISGILDAQKIRYTIKSIDGHIDILIEDIVNGDGIS